MKLNAGCGHEILEGYTNLDCVPLRHVDVVHDLSKFPWPFQENTFKVILLKHVLEHIPDTLKAMEEVWRISKENAEIEVHVPYWNAEDSVTDPTHARAFNEYTFDFFDPLNKRCRERSYYGKARFQIQEIQYHTRLFGRYYQIPKLLTGLFLGCAHFLCNIIQVIVFKLRVIK